MINQIGNIKLSVISMLLMKNIMTRDDMTALRDIHRDIGPSRLLNLGDAGLQPDRRRRRLTDKNKVSSI
jgi:hypothetical protein